MALGLHQGLRPSLMAYWSNTVKQMFFFGLQSKEAQTEFLNFKFISNISIMRAK